MYKYTIRPCFKSTEYLIEFFIDQIDDEFFKQLFQALEVIDIQVGDIQDLWINNEVLLNCNSNIGQFMISIDSWDMVFIMASDNQAAVQQLSELLNTQESFMEIEADHSRYQ
ncbi:MAG: hypothetical protein R2941_05245 [Desulfobacterales bacterium]